jgi:glutamine amidotransferase|tara:strand:+ start:36 stop:650 length:615 start_codon:yes stop_codon:yes gene_type:complete
MITIIDLGLGNINSVSRALDYLGITNRISDNIHDVEHAEALILPGVGNFSEASNRLCLTDMVTTIQHEVLNNKKPFLGICLGMQLLAETGEESGVSQGLGLIKARACKLRSETKGYRLPHIGWNDVAGNNMNLFSNIEDRSCFYFAHSYEIILEDKDVEYAICNYGVDFVAVVKKNNIVGVQFHPEKSQKPGLQLLKNFIQGVF